MHDLNADLTEEQWQAAKRELAEFGCFYDDEDEIMRNLRIVRAEIYRERVLEEQRREREAGRPADARREPAAAR